MVREPALSQLRRKVAYTAMENMKPEAAAVRVVLKDGRSLQAEVRHCRGSPGRPLTDTDLADKTRGQLQTAFPADIAERILAECWRIGDCPRVDALCGLLAAEK